MRATLSLPAVGKHIKFDGCLLHAAPCDVISDRSADDDTNVEDSDSDGSSAGDGIDKSSDQQSGDGNIKESHEREVNDDDNNNGSDNNENSSEEGEVDQRVTFLVNIWLNHKPLNSNPFPLPKSSRKRGRGKVDSKRTTDNTVRLPTLCTDNQQLPCLTFNEPEFVISVKFSNYSSSLRSSLSLVSSNMTTTESNVIRRKWVFYEGMSTNKCMYVVDMPLYSNMREQMQIWMDDSSSDNKGAESKVANCSSGAGGGAVVIDYEGSSNMIRLRRPNNR